MAEHASRLRRIVRAFQRPQVSLVLLVLVVIDVFTLAPGFNYSYTGSRVGNALGSLRPPMSTEAPSWRPPTVNIAYYASADELRLARRGDERTWDVYYNIYASSSVTRTGWWGVTDETRTLVVMADIAGNPGGTLRALPADILDRVTTLYLEQITSDDPLWRRVAEQMRRSVRRTYLGGALESRRVLWAGWARNAASIVLALAFVCSLWWIPARWLERRRWRRLARGICPDCRYELGSMSPEAPCPECGIAHPARVMGACTASAWERFWRRVRTPGACVVLTLVLAADVLLLPKSERSGSRVGLWLGTPAMVRDPGDGEASFAQYIGVSRAGAGWSFADLGPVWPVAETVGKNHDAVWTLRHHTSSNGLWAPVRATTYWSLSGDPARVGDRAAVVEAMYRWLADRGQGDRVARLRELGTRPAPWFKTRWSGHVHNAASMGVGLLWLCSWGWIVDLARRRRWRLGRCPTCGTPTPERLGACTLCGERPV